MSKVQEVKAMGAIAAALEELGPDDDALARVLGWAVAAYAPSVQCQSGLVGPAPLSFEVEPAAGRKSAPPTSFESIGEVVEAAKPRTAGERALVAAYWFITIKQGQDFGGQEVNNELKNMGHGVGNITELFNSLINRSPQLVRQTKKSGTSRQARKRYTITEAGKKLVEKMLSGTHTLEDVDHER